MKKKISNRKSNPRKKTFQYQLSLFSGAETPKLEISANAAREPLTDQATRVLARVYAMILSWPLPKEEAESNKETKGN